MSETREDCVSPEQSPAAKELGKLRAILKILQPAIEPLDKPLSENHPYLIELRSIYRCTDAYMQRPIRYGGSDHDPSHSISLDESRQFEALAKEITALIITCQPIEARAEPRGLLTRLFGDVRILSPTAERLQKQSAYGGDFSVIQHPTLATRAMQTAQQNDDEEKK